MHIYIHMNLARTDCNAYIGRNHGGRYPPSDRDVLSDRRTKNEKGESFEPNSSSSSDGEYSGGEGGGRKRGRGREQDVFEKESRSYASLHHQRGEGVKLKEEGGEAKSVFERHALAAERPSIDIIQRRQQSKANLSPYDEVAERGNERTVEGGHGNKERGGGRVGRSSEEFDHLMDEFNSLMAQVNYHL
jgi:hypothetical protein